MTYQELYTLLASTNIQVAYDHFTSKVNPPLILYRSTGISAFGADDCTFYKDADYVVDLVTSFKDITTETTLETLFDNNNIFYTKDETYIDAEQIYQIRYFI